MVKFLKSQVSINELLEHQRAITKARFFVCQILS